MRPASGSWKTYRGCTSPKPAPEPPTCCQPSSRQGLGQGDGVLVGAVRWHVAQPLGLAAGDGVLEGRGRPAAYGQLRPHLHRERLLLLQGALQRAEDVLGVVRLPVEDGALGQVGEVALEAGRPAKQDQPGPDQRRAVEPAEVQVSPLGLDPGPGRALQEGRGPLGDEREMGLAIDRADVQATCGHPTGAGCAFAEAALSCVRARGLAQMPDRVARA